MVSIDERAGLVADPLPAESGVPSTPAEPEIVPAGGGWKLPEWLFIKRLDEPVEKYMEHPLNFGKSEGWAYVIRGGAALGKGVLDYWWMDVVGGAMRIRKERAGKEGGGEVGKMG